MLSDNFVTASCCTMSNSITFTTQSARTGWISWLVVFVNTPIAFVCRHCFRTGHQTEMAQLVHNVHHQFAVVVILNYLKPFTASSVHMIITISPSSGVYWLDLVSILCSNVNISFSSHSSVWWYTINVATP